MSIEGLSIEQTVALQDLSALSRVTRLSRNLVVTDTTLDTLAGLEGITEVVGYLNVQRNGALADLDGLAGVERVGKTVFIVDDPLITSVDGLSSLARVDESISITDLPALTSVALPVEAVRLSVQVVRNPELATLTLPALTEAGEVELHGNPMLTDVAAPALVEVHGWLQVDDCDALTTIGDFTALTTVDERVSITRNDGLASLSTSLSALTEVGENFDVHDNPSLPACDVDAVATAISDLGGLVVNTGNDEAAACP